jgi:transcriptional regulator with XRE-family HTH domain
MPRSVSRFTDRLQGGFLAWKYACRVQPPDLLTAQDRIVWAIQRCKAQGITPEALAARAGLSRPGMLHWTKETTDVSEIGVGKLMAFARAAGVHLEWLVSGTGPAFQGSSMPAEAVDLAAALALLAAEEPAEYRVIVRMIRTAGHDPGENKL